MKKVKSQTMRTEQLEKPKVSCCETMIWIYVCISIIPLPMEIVEYVLAQATVIGSTLIWPPTPRNITQATLL